MQLTLLDVDTSDLQPVAPSIANTLRCRYAQKGAPRRPRKPREPQALPLILFIERRSTAWTEALEDELAARWFALQRVQAIAHDMGFSLPKVANKALRLELPERYGFVLHNDYRPERRAENARLFQGWRREKCRFRKKWFWTNRAGVRFSEEARKCVGFRMLMEGAGNDFSLAH